MGKNANELVMRDPAAAALYGISGADFGFEPELLAGNAEFGSDFDMDFDPDFDADFDADSDDFGTEFGGGIAFGADPAPAAAAHAMAQRSAAHHASTPAGRAIIAHHMKQKMHRDSRAMLLEPNKHSDLKVERYTFSVSVTITALGTAGALTGTNSPDVNFRPQRVTTNVVSPGMVTISDARVANVSFVVGGLIDAWQWNANAVDSHLDVPTLTPANRATFSGSYTGLVPSPLSGTGSYPFILSFSGPASIVA